MAVAAISALLAAATLLVFLHQYRKDLTGSTPERVLVARSLIPKGTPGAVVASNHLYREVKVRTSQVKGGVITDPSALEERIATRSVYPGQALSTKAFAAGSKRVFNHLSGYQRAISAPVDAAHGLIGKIQPGDSVDVLGTLGNQYSGSATAVVLARNAMVLSVPSKAKQTGIAGTGTQNATLRVSDDEATSVAAFSDHGKIWLVARPPVGARSHSSAGAARRSLKANITIDAKVSRGR